MDSKQTPAAQPQVNNAECCSQQGNPPPYTASNISHASPLLHNNHHIQRPVVLVGALNESIRMYCPYENIEVDTQISYSPGIKAGFFSALLCFVACPIFWVPLAMRSCKEEAHKCPSCGRFLAFCQ
ncbi:hypothetical protein DSO57_1003295 [Entomophthora muscae]|uniref:Uncharacterized protein n=1 Tax=Entomophthora muscae TaxID=34485 RepID=A0ACC2T8K9_9FUNG|nr:hypothetical protein DSO57_1003295 [Entomophthora muscae]